MNGVCVSYIDVSELPQFDGSGQHLVVMELPEGADEGTFRVHGEMVK